MRLHWVNSRLKWLTNLVMGCREPVVGSFGKIGVILLIPTPIAISSQISTLWKISLRLKEGFTSNIESFSMEWIRFIRLKASETSSVVNLWKNVEFDDVQWMEAKLSGKKIFFPEEWKKYDLVQALIKRN